MNTMNYLTLALRNKNVMDVTKELVCINFCFGNNWFCYIQLLRIQIRQLSDSKRVSKCKHDYYWQSMLCSLSLFFITESLNFKTAKLLKLGVNIIADTTWHMLSLTLPISLVRNTGAVAD